MGKRPSLDYVEIKEPKYKKLLDLGINPELPEKLGFEPIPFMHLNSIQKEEVTEFYSDRWMHVHETEYEVGFLEAPDTTGLSKREAIIIGVWNQLKKSGEKFPEGQMVLVDKGTNRPVTLRRSQLWHVTDFMDQERYFKEVYPTTWYLVSDYGNGYSWIPMKVNGKIKKFKDYEEVLKIENPLLNLDDDMLISNYALTGNPNMSIRGASRAAVAEVARFAVDHGIKHCDTCSPLNNYTKWKEEKRKQDPNYDTSPNRFVHENVVIPLNEGNDPEYWTAIGMHKKFGAWEMKIMPNARIYDKDSGGHCGFCRYF